MSMKRKLTFAALYATVLAGCVTYIATSGIGIAIYWAL